MTEYKGFSYEKLNNSKWKVIYPSGFKFVTPGDEQKVKELIDEIIESKAE